MSITQLAHHIEMTCVQAGGEEFYLTVESQPEQEEQITLASLGQDEDLAADD